MRIESELIVLLMAAPATGTLMVTWAGLASAMASSRLPHTSSYTRARIEPSIPKCRSLLWVQLSAGVVLAFAFGIHTASGQLSVFGAVCCVSVIAIGVPTCVRINKQVARRIRFHVIRTLFSVPAFALYAAAMILSTT